MVFLFSNFSDTTASLFTSADEVEFFFEGTEVELDMTVDMIRQHVPEPLTMLGMFLGLGSVGAYIRKRRLS